MSAAKDMRRALEVARLDGGTISAGCTTCPLLKNCGGYTRVGAAWSCMDECSKCDSSCTRVCLRRPKDFARSLLEVGGLGFETVPALTVPAALPHYVPVLQHALGEDTPLEWAAVPLRAVMRFVRARYVPIAESAAGLRMQLGLANTTKIVLLGSGKDRTIESYWRWRRAHDVPAALARLGFAAAISSNYSMFLEDPRPQHLVNRKRILRVAAEWSENGIPVVPFLQAVTGNDWEYWTAFIKTHAEITTVAMEFQTGLAHPKRGDSALEAVRRLQDEVGRALHLVAIGGARLRRSLAAAFASWTVVDSTPFMKAVKRRVVDRVEPRRPHWVTALGEDVGDLLLHNVVQYSNWIAPQRGVETG